MSAWVVSKAHIDYLLTAGLEIHGEFRSDLYWFDARPGADDGTHQEGEPWGPGTAAWLRDHQRHLTTETAGQVGAMLWAENRRSVNHRYAEDEIEEPYLFRRVDYPDPIVAFKALGCYEYQSCEHPGWFDSEAYAFCQALKDRLVDAIVRRYARAEYEAAPWGIDESHVTRNTVSLTELMDRRKKKAG